MKLNNLTLDANKIIELGLCLIFYQISFFVSIFILKNSESSLRSIASKRILQFLGIPPQKPSQFFDKWG